MLGGQPKENKGMGAVTLTEGLQKQNSLLASLQLGQRGQSGWHISSTHGAAPPRPGDGATCPGQTKHHCCASI